MKRKLALGVVISAVFLYLAARGIEWDQFLAALRRTRYLFLIPAIVFTMLGHFSRSVRWKYMMTPVKDCRIGPLWTATAIAFMVNNLLPARLGEIVRAVVIGRSERVSRSAAFATIVYERVVDVFVLIILLWYSMVTISGPPWLARSAGILIAFNVALFALLFAMVRWRNRFRALLERALRPLPGDTRDRLHVSADSFIDGLGVVTQPRASLPIVALSVAVWGCAILGVYFCVVAFRLEVPLLASLFLIVVISLGSMIPSAPAFLGTMQYACVIGLAAFGIQRADALAFSTVYHATQFFPITLAGLYYAWRSHLRVSDLSGQKLS
ncbi:MAG TPA: lysylphosphatidylglycerol synthase transmembrane domain-containing protein [Candidatus Krumholzibacteria bacterium]|nr:lysylphosphatidylglycerol synthase transmembrane domain-containing protein [Candidatus Krumholzibacteria bacterium]